MRYGFSMPPETQMTPTIPHDPAYPLFCEQSGPCYGLTKREYFAALAMQGMMADPETGGRVKPEVIAGNAVAHADALVASLNRVTEA